MPLAQTLESSDHPQERDFTLSGKVVPRGFGRAPWYGSIWGFAHILKYNGLQTLNTNV